MRDGPIIGIVNQDECREIGPSEGAIIECVLWFYKEKYLPGTNVISVKTTNVGERSNAFGVITNVELIPPS